MNSSSNFLEILGNDNQKYIEIEPKSISKVIVSGTTEGYGYLSHMEKIFNVVNKENINTIVDGFIPDNSVMKLPNEQVFYNPALSFWFVWNVLWKNNNKSCQEFANLHKNNINNILNTDKKRKTKFVSLNRNFKAGREIFIESITQEFIDENWITGHFSDRNNLKNDKLVNDDFKHFYILIFKQLKNSGYIQPFFESSGLNDGLTDKMLMITEKSCIPFMLGNIAIPMNLFYVSEYEKLGFKFVKNINGVSINETIDWDYNMDINYPKKWLKEQIEKILLINKNNSLQDIEKVYKDNIDIIRHNQKLVKNLMTDNSVIDKLKHWIEK